MVYDIKKVDQNIESGAFISGVVTLGSGAVLNGTMGSGVVTAMKLNYMTATMLSGSGSAQRIAHNWSGTAPTLYAAWVERALSGIETTVAITVSTSCINVTATANANYGYLVIK